MLSKDEQGFMEYWEQNRLRKKRVWRHLSVGLPLAVALCGAILISVYSGWNVGGELLESNNNGGKLVERDNSVRGLLEHNKERFFIMLIGVLLIVVFIVIFAARHRWDLNEQHYKELTARKEKA